VGFLDKIGSGLVGAYHSGVVVAKKEWAFGGHDAAGCSGVYSTEPEMNPDFIFYQRLIMGRMQATPDLLQDHIREISCKPEWRGCTYDVFERNCNHFASDLCWLLLRKRPPEWINSSAEGIALSQRRSVAEASALEEALAAYGSGKSAANGDDASQLPDLDRFTEAFKHAFELRWVRGRKACRASTRHDACPEGQDPVVLRRDAETKLLAACALAGQAAGFVAAAAAQQAATARAEAVAKGFDPEVWDEVWARERDALARSWRELAARDGLDPDPTGEQSIQRAEHVRVALAEATQVCLAVIEARKHANAIVTPDRHISEAIVEEFASYVGQ